MSRKTGVSAPIPDGRDGGYGQVTFLIMIPFYESGSLFDSPCGIKIQ